MTIQVFNPTAEPIGPFRFGGREIIFQPDQDKNPGSYRYELAPKLPPHGPEGAPTLEQIKTYQEDIRMGRRPAGRFVKISDERLATNVLELEDDFKRWFDGNSSERKAVVGAEKLEFGEAIINRIKVERDHFRLEALKAREEFEKQKEELKAALEAERAEMAKQLAIARSEAKLSNTRVVK